MVRVRMSGTSWCSPSTVMHCVTCVTCVACQRSAERTQALRRRVCAASSQAPCGRACLRRPSSSHAACTALTSGGMSDAAGRPPGKLARSKRRTQQNTLEVRKRVGSRKARPRRAPPHHTSGGSSPSAPPRSVNSTLARPAWRTAAARQHAQPTRAPSGSRADQRPRAAVAPAHAHARQLPPAAALPRVSARTAHVAERNEHCRALHARRRRNNGARYAPQVVRHAQPLQLAQQRRLLGGEGGGEAAARAGVVQQRGKRRARGASARRAPQRRHGAAAARSRGGLARGRYGSQRVPPHGWLGVAQRAGGRRGAGVIFLLATCCAPLHRMLLALRCCQPPWSPWQRQERQGLAASDETTIGILHRRNSNRAIAPK
jgi:hypothetical protein